MRAPFVDLIMFQRAGEYAVDSDLTIPPAQVQTMLHLIATRLDAMAQQVKLWGSGPGATPPLSDEEQTRLLRAQLMVEELGETIEALMDGDRVALADGLADLLYVTVGTAVTYGIDLPAVWDEVHRSNMAKFGPGSWKDASGKVQKPPGWTSPDVAAVMGSGDAVKRLLVEIADRAKQIDMDCP